METSVTAVEMAEKSRVRVALTRVSTLSSAAWELWKAATATLEEELAGRALTVN